MTERRQEETPDFLESLGEDLRPGVDDVAAFPSRVDRYAKAHKRALDMADYIGALPPDQAAHIKNIPVKEIISSFSAGDFSKLVDLADQLRTCGAYLLFRDYFTLGMIRLAGACFCKKHLICPLCAIRRGAKFLKSYLHKLESIQENNSLLKPYLITFTVKNGHSLHERFNTLSFSMKKYLQQRRNHLKNKGPYVEACKASAAVWSYEFKKGKNSGLWHPHIHAIWLCEIPPDQEQLSKDWLNVTKDSFIVDVRPINTQDDAVGGFLEVFKYAVKFAELPLADNWEGYRVLNGRRLISSFGEFRGIKEPDDLADELLAEDLPFIEILLRYRPGVGYTVENVSSATPASSAA
jgi:hypothetical protein